LGKALSREVREGRMIDSFTKYLGFAEWWWFNFLCFPFFS
jgi:hypothetical protein